MSKTITAFAPASVSNLGCGFDVLGFALDGPGDLVSARLDAGIHSLTIETIHGDKGILPRDPRENTAGIAVWALLEKISYAGPGIALTIDKKMPFASGIGSSAASAAAAVKAVNRLLGEPLNLMALLGCVIKAEAFISGSAHADNAAPALFGGMVLARSVNPLDILQLPVPEDLYYALLYPDVVIKTSEARDILPLSIPLKTAVHHWANTAALVHALHCADFDLLTRSMQDFIAEPLRSKNIPNFESLKQTALENGALTFNISGSGPAVFAFCRSGKDAADIAAKLLKVSRDKNVAGIAWSGAIRSKGAEILGVKNKNKRK